MTPLAPLAVAALSLGGAAVAAQAPDAGGMPPRDAATWAVLEGLSDEEFALTMMGAMARMGCTLSTADNDALVAGITQAMLGLLGLDPRPGPALAAEIEARMIETVEANATAFEVDETAQVVRLRRCG